MATMSNFEKAWAAAVGKVWADESGEYKRRLKADPVVMLNELGAEIEPGILVEIVEQSPRKIVAMLPGAPPEVETMNNVRYEFYFGQCPCTVCNTGVSDLTNDTTLGPKLES